MLYYNKLARKAWQHMFLEAGIMKKFFRNALSLGLVLALALTAAGCSNADKGGETGSTEGEVSSRLRHWRPKKGKRL